MSQTQKQLPPQYMFVSNRDIIVTSTRGYSLEFKKGVPMHAPKPMHAELIEKGILPAAEDGSLDVEKMTQTLEGDKPAVVVSPEDPDERALAIESAIRALAERNNPADFTAGGVPAASSLTAALGWRVDLREVRTIWNRVKAEMAQKARG